MQLIKPILDIFKLNTRLLKNCLIDISDEQAKIRLNDNTNNIIFIVCHLLNSRYYLAQIIGLPLENPFKDLFEKARKIDDFHQFPLLSDLLSNWEIISEKITNELTNLSEETLLSNSLIPIPIIDKTILGTITFLEQHESYHIGQISFIRKHLGFTAMSYK